MWGSSPDADEVTRSIGTSHPAPRTPHPPGFSFLAVSTAAVTASTSFLLVGPRFVPLEFAASYPVPAADGRPWKYPGDEKDCPMIRYRDGKIVQRWVGYSGADQTTQIRAAIRLELGRQPGAPHTHHGGAGT